MKKELIKYIFVDIVGFTRSDRSEENRLHILRKLNEIILSATRHAPFDKRFFLPTGDGVCIAFRPWEGQKHDIEFQTSISLLKKLKDYNDSTSNALNRFEVRVGLNQDDDQLVVDINGHINFAGNGINYACRVMDLADERQIFIGENTAPNIRTEQGYALEKYVLNIKHHEDLVVYQYKQVQGDAPDGWLNSKGPKGKKVEIARYDTEYKFQVPKIGKVHDLVIRQIKNHIEKLDSWQIQTDEGDIEPWEQCDTYLDDDAFALNTAGASFRIRKKGKETTATLKLKYPLQTDGYKRTKASSAISKSQDADLISGKPIEIQSYQLIPYVAPFCRCHELRPRLELNCKRKLIKLSNTNKPVGRVLVCIDLLTFKFEGLDDTVVAEIEVKGKGAEPAMVKEFAENLAENLDLRIIKQSRYEYGIALQKGFNARVNETPVNLDTN